MHRTELQKARLETSKRDEQVAELQRALSDAHLYLFDEREHLLRVTSENAELRGMPRACFDGILPVDTLVSARC